MEQEKIYSILSLILSRIKDESFKWRLDGSVNLLVQGISDAKPKDLDIRTWKEGIRIFRENLRDFIVKDYYNEEKKAFSIVLEIFGEEVEINNYSDWNEDCENPPKIVDWKGLELRCLSLEDAEKFYRQSGRIESADKLKSFLSRNQ
jgi:hypothetical protein